MVKLYALTISQHKNSANKADYETVIKDVSIKYRLKINEVIHEVGKNSIGDHVHGFIEVSDKFNPFPAIKYINGCGLSTRITEVYDEVGWKEYINKDQRDPQILQDVRRSVDKVKNKSIFKF